MLHLLSPSTHKLTRSPLYPSPHPHSPSVPPSPPTPPHTQVRRHFAVEDSGIFADLSCLAGLLADLDAPLYFKLRQVGRPAVGVRVGGGGGRVQLISRY